MVSFQGRSSAQSRGKGGSAFAPEVHGWRSSCHRQPTLEIVIRIEESVEIALYITKKAALEKDDVQIFASQSPDSQIFEITSEMGNTEHIRYSLFSLISSKSTFMVSYNCSTKSRWVKVEEEKHDEKLSLLLHIGVSWNWSTDPLIVEFQTRRLSDAIPLCMKGILSHFSFERWGPIIGADNSFVQIVICFRSEFRIPSH